MSAALPFCWLNWLPLWQAAGWWDSECCGAPGASNIRRPARPSLVTLQDRLDQARPFFDNGPATTRPFRDRTAGFAEAPLGCRCPAGGAALERSSRWPTANGPGAVCCSRSVGLASRKGRGDEKSLRAALARQPCRARD